MGRELFSPRERRANFITSCLFAGGMIVAFYLADSRWEQIKQTAAEQGILRRQQILRLSEENSRLSDGLQKIRDAAAGVATDDDPVPPEITPTEQLAALREIFEWRRRGLAALASAPYRHESGSTQNALAPIEPGSRGGLTPAFVEIFGLSSPDAAELDSACRETKRRLEELALASVFSGMNPDGSWMIEVKRPAEADFHLSALRDAFARVLGPERFEMLDGLMERGPAVIAIEGTAIALRPQTSGAFQAYLKPLGGSDYTLTIGRQPGADGEMVYQLTTTVEKSSLAAAADLALNLKDGEWHQPLKEKIITGQKLSSRDKAVLKLGPLLERFLPPGF
jgi:hypothetical protein